MRPHSVDTRCTYARNDKKKPPQIDRVALLGCPLRADSGHGGKSASRERVRPIGL